MCREWCPERDREFEISIVCRLKVSSLDRSERCWSLTEPIKVSSSKPHSKVSNFRVRSFDRSKFERLDDSSLESVESDRFAPNRLGAGRSGREFDSSQVSKFDRLGVRTFKVWSIESLHGVKVREFEGRRFGNLQRLKI